MAPEANMTLNIVDSGGTIVLSLLVPIAYAIITVASTGLTVTGDGEVVSEQAIDKSVFSDSEDPDDVQTTIYTYIGSGTWNGLDGYAIGSTVDVSGYEAGDKVSLRMSIEEGGDSEMSTKTLRGTWKLNDTFVDGNVTEIRAKFTYNNSEYDAIVGLGTSAVCTTSGYKIKGFFKILSSRWSFALDNGELVIYDEGVIPSSGSLMPDIPVVVEGDIGDKFLDYSTVDAYTSDGTTIYAVTAAQVVWDITDTYYIGNGPTDPDTGEYYYITIGPDYYDSETGQMKLSLPCSYSVDVEINGDVVIHNTDESYKDLNVIAADYDESIEGRTITFVDTQEVSEDEYNLFVANATEQVLVTLQGIYVFNESLVDSPFDGSIDLTSCTIKAEDESGATDTLPQALSYFRYISSTDEDYQYPSSEIPSLLSEQYAGTEYEEYADAMTSGGYGVSSSNSDGNLGGLLYYSTVSSSWSGSDFNYGNWIGTIDGGVHRLVSIDFGDGLEVNEGFAAWVKANATSISYSTLSSGRYTIIEDAETPTNTTGEWYVNLLLDEVKYTSIKVTQDDSTDYHIYFVNSSTSRVIWETASSVTNVGTLYVLQSQEVDSNVTTIISRLFTREGNIYYKAFRLRGNTINSVNNKSVYQVRIGDDTYDPPVEAK